MPTDPTPYDIAPLHFAGVSQILFCDPTKEHCRVLPFGGGCLSLLSTHACSGRYSSAQLPLLRYSEYNTTDSVLVNREYLH